MFIILLCMAIGMVLGFCVRNLPNIIRPINPLVNISIYALLFLLGVSIGINNTVISHIQELATRALLLALGGMTGSIVLAFFVFRFFFEKKE